MADSGYILMHKNIPVADLQLDRDTGLIRSVGQVYHAAHLPVGVQVSKGAVDRRALNTWWTNRAIPDSRDRIQDAHHPTPFGTVSGVEPIRPVLDLPGCRQRGMGSGELLSKPLFR